jgi:Zn-dependent M16 (insulinase) family peptidase
LLRGEVDCRLAIEVSKAQNDIPSAKRDGYNMARDVRSAIHLDENTSSWRAATTLRQETLLDELEKALEEDEEAVVAKFERLRAECTVPDVIQSNLSGASAEIEGEYHRRCIIVTTTCFNLGRLPPYSKTSITSPSDSS